MSDVKMNLPKLNYDCSEAYKTLRTNLGFCGKDKKAIVVTSCAPDEGKSTVVLYLSVSLAESRKKVLLIDADLRKSIMAGRFESSDEIYGLTHYLSGQADMDSVVYKTDQENMDMIFAGPIPPNPAELLADEQFAALVKTMRERYDYVLIDSAPLGSVIDSAIIAEQCDGSIIVIEAETISYRFLQEIKTQLEKSNCPILGTILNKIDVRQQKYYSRYYGKYYGKDSKK